MDTVRTTEDPVTEAAPAQAPSSPQRLHVTSAFPAAGASCPVDGVPLVTIDRPEALNALSFDLLDQLAAELERLDADDACRAIVLTGAGTRVFAPGANIKELAPQTPITLTNENRFAVWDRIGAVRTPTIAAVRGFALGGGRELAMSCELIGARADPQLGQPEIKIGVMPGAGGTQRMTRAIGKAKAMELILSGRTMPCRVAECAGV